MKLLINEQQKSYENAKSFYVCKDEFEDKYAKDKKCCKVKDRSDYTGEYRDGPHSKYSLKYSVPKKFL